MREVFIAYLYLLKEQARQKYETDVLLWASLAPHQKKPGKPPKPPDLLRRAAPED